MTTHSYARIEDGKIYIEAEVFDTFLKDDDRRMILLSRCMTAVTELQQEIFAMNDSDVIAESDAILRRMRANT